MLPPKYHLNLSIDIQFPLLSSLPRLRSPLDICNSLQNAPSTSILTLPTTGGMNFRKCKSVRDTLSIEKREWVSLAFRLKEQNLRRGPECVLTPSSSSLLKSYLMFRSQFSTGDVFLTCLSRSESHIEFSQHCGVSF